MANLAFNRIHVSGPNERLKDVEAFIVALPHENLYSMLDTYVSWLDHGSIEIHYASKWEIDEGPYWAITEKFPDVDAEYDGEDAED